MLDHFDPRWKQVAAAENDDRHCAPMLRHPDGEADHHAIVRAGPMVLVAISNGSA
jgi:hypothetical protein